MGHDHDHSAMEGYYLDQISTIAACGLLGGISFLIWKTDLLARFNILTDQFTRPVLFGGSALIVIAILRAVSLWSTAAKTKALALKQADVHHHHDHDHDHECDHSHAPGEVCDHDHQHDHDHDHAQDHDHEHGHSHSHAHDHEHGHEHIHVHAHDGHDHAFAPWRYAVLLLPMMLSGLLIYYHFQGLQLQYSKDWLLRQQGGKDVELAAGGSVAEKSERVYLGFKELSEAAMSRDPTKRQYFEGRVGKLEGLYSPISDTQFTIFRMRMTCCASDAVPVKVRIISPNGLARSGLKPGEGVSVEGKIEFRKVANADQYFPVMILKSPDDATYDSDAQVYDKNN